MKISDFIAEFLYKKKVKNIYSLPGGGAMHLIDSFTKHQGLNQISFFHEQGATIAAESAARTAGNQISVCCVTTGPGATNAITAVAGAWIESTPLVVISGQVKRSDMLNGRKLRQVGVQEVDITKIVEPITKFAYTLKRLDEIAFVMEKAIYEAISKRKGPVWIDIPLDIQGSPAPTISKMKKFIPPKKLNKKKININKIIRLLDESTKPIFLWGNGVKGENLKKDIRSLIINYSLPSMFTWNASDILEYDSEMYLGRPGVVAQRHSNILIQISDLIVCIGTSLDNVLTAYNSKDFGRNAKKIIINIDIEQLKNIKIPNSMKIHSSAKEFLVLFKKYLKKENKKFCKNVWKLEFLKLKKRFQNDFPNEIEDKSLISHKDCVLALSNLLDTNQLIATGSSGLAIEAFYMIFRNKKGQSYFLTSGLGSMGFGLPSAIGIAVENKDKDVVLIESDGSLAMNIQELQTVKNNKLPICIFLMNNSGYASIRNTQSNYFNDRFFGTGIEAGQKMPNWELIAKSYAFNYSKVNALDKLKKIYFNFKKDKHPIIIDILLTKNEKLLPKCAAMPQKDGSILSMPLEDMTPLLPLDELTEIMNKKISIKSKKFRK